MSYQALLFCTDEKTARVLTQVLTELEFNVEASSEPFAAVKLLMAKQFDALVVDCDNEQNSALLFKSARNSSSNQSSLAVAVVEGQAGVAKAFRIGANLVLTKPINVEQSKGTLRVARGLLRKAESAKSPAATQTATKHPATPIASFTTTSSASAAASAPAKTVITPFIAEIPRIPAAATAASSSSSSFDIQEDPTPALDSTEAAFLESIPRASTISPERKVSTPSKESPWRQISKPAGGASMRDNDSAHEVARRVSSPDSAAHSASTRHPFGTGALSAGAAAAPAKEFPRSAKTQPAADSETVKPREKVLESKVNFPDTAVLNSSDPDAVEDAPVFSQGSSENKPSRMPVILALAVITLAAAGYFGWSKLHNGAVVTTPPSATQIQPTTPDSATTGNAQQGADISAQTQSMPTQVEVLSGQPTAPSSASKSDLPSAAIPKTTKPTPGKIIATADSEDASDVVVKSFPSGKTEPTMTLNSAPADQPIAPPSLQMSVNANDETVAGLMSATPLTVPKRGSEVLKVSQGITEGMLLKKVAPVYPSQAIQLRKQGVVVLLANIGKNGSITNAKVLQGDALLSQAALGAVRQWKYKPYLLNGQPIEVQTQISVNFKLP